MRRSPPPRMFQISFFILAMAATKANEELVTATVWVGLYEASDTSSLRFHAMEEAIDVNGSHYGVNPELSVVEFINKTIACLEAKLDSVLMNSQSGNCQSQKFTSSVESRVFSLSSRVIEMENEIDAMRLSIPSCSTKTKSPPESNMELVSELESELKSLQKAFADEKSKTEDMRNKIRFLDQFFTSAEDNICGSSHFNITKFRQKPVSGHLQRIGFNVLQGKPANASSVYSSEYGAHFAIDEDFSTRYSSAQETNPWFLVDLQGPHLIWEIRLTLYQDSNTRPFGIKVYVEDELNFSYHGKPETKSLPVFGHIPRDPASLTVYFTHPRGICGRFVIVVREILNQYLTFWEIGAVGYALV